MPVMCGPLIGQQRRRVVMPYSLSKHTPVWVGLSWASFFIGLLSVSVLAKGRSSISGVVLQEGQGVAGHRIMLIRLGPNHEVERTPGETDAQGQFVFDNLETGELFEYFVGIRQEGQLYRSEPIRLEQGQHRTGVVVDASVSSPHTVEEDSPPLQIANHLMVIVFRGDHLEVREVVRMLNRGSASSTGSGGASLHLPLPQGYYNLLDVQGLTPEHVRLHASGLYYTVPLPPGEQRVVYTYSLPLRHDVITILSQRTLPTAALDVLVEEEHLVATSDLQFSGRVALEPHTFSHFHGIDLAPHTRSWLQLTWRTKPLALIRAGAYSLILCLALLGIGLPLYGTWRRRGRHAHAACITPEQLQELHAERLRVLQTIARLDDQHETDPTEEGVYQQRRQVYKKQLLELVVQLRQVQQDKEGTN